MRARIAAALFLFFLAGAVPARAQIDPERRQLLQLGYDKSSPGAAPLSGYAFYYLNRPKTFVKNGVLRLAVAPVYADSEFGLLGAAGKHTDLAFGLSGGGFAQGHIEMRGGHYFPEESFTGYGTAAYVALYRRVNPGARIPLSAVLRAGAQYAVFTDRRETAEDFVVPPDNATLFVRGGVRWGGREPELEVKRAMELSAWYEGRLRTESGPYGFNGDRRLERDAHLYWGRALLNYGPRKAKRRLSAGLTAGGSEHIDRLSAYRLGGGLTLSSEFPLNIPGYHYQELSARRFALIDASYGVWLNHHFGANLRAAFAHVDYVPGMEQPGNFHSGVGGALDYDDPDGAWKIVLAYGYGFSAIRDDRRGAHGISFMIQYNIRAEKGTPREVPRIDRPYWQILRRPRG